MTSLTRLSHVALLMVNAMTIALGQMMPSMGMGTVTRTMFVNALLTDYDNTVTPTFDKPVGAAEAVPTVVNVSLYINSINSINEQFMDFSLNLFVTQTWYDYRLQFFNMIDDDYLELDSKLTSKFWVPDLYFVNEKSSDFHDVTVPNQLLHLYRDGKVVYKLRISLTATCNMKLQKFPMDEQVCTLYMKSFGYTDNSLQFAWAEHKPLNRHPRIEISQFTLMDLNHRECEADLLQSEDNSTFTCLAVDLTLHRSIGFYMIQIYVPSALIVVLSWVSFCLDVSAVPARISLGILTVLTMTNMKTIAVSSLPKVSYIKAIDVWMATCLAFVFASLLEFAIVNAFARKTTVAPDNQWTKMVIVEDPKPMGQQQTFQPSNMPPAPPSPQAATANSVRLARQIDIASMFLFPATFATFILGYIFVYQ